MHHHHLAENNHSLKVFRQKATKKYFCSLTRYPCRVQTASSFSEVRKHSNKAGPFLKRYLFAWRLTGTRFLQLLNDHLVPGLRVCLLKPSRAPVIETLTRSVVTRGEGSKCF